jgi:hypothetical protein
MPRLPKELLIDRTYVRLTPQEKDYLAYLCKIEHMSISEFLRKAIRLRGEELGVSFYQLNKMGAEAYHDYRQQLLIAQGRASELSRELKKTKEQLEMYKHGR